MQFTLECEREEDGRWLAEVGQLPGVLAHGASASEAMAKAEILALRVAAEGSASNTVRPKPCGEHDPGPFDRYVAVRTKYLGDARPASMLLIVPELVKPAFLLEVEAIAARVGS